MTAENILTFRSLFQFLHFGWCGKEPQKSTSKGSRQYAVCYSRQQTFADRCFRQFGTGVRPYCKQPILSRTYTTLLSNINHSSHNIRGKQTDTHSAQHSKAEKAPAVCFRSNTHSNNNNKNDNENDRGRKCTSSSSQNLA